MKTCLSLAGLLCAAVLLNSCVTTRISGSRLRGEDHAAFSKIVVYCDATDDALREEIEGDVAENLSGSYLEAVRSVDLLTEAREYSEAETSEIMTSTGADGLLRVLVDEFSTATQHRPGFVRAYHGLHFTHVVVHPPRDVTRTDLHLSLELIDRATGRPVWRGVAQTRGSGHRDLRELARSAGAKLRHEMWRDGLIRSNP